MKELWFFFPTVIRTRRERRIVPAFQKNSDKQKSLPSVSRKGLSVPYEARMRKQKTPHDNKTDLSVSFFIRCLGSLIRTNAWYSQPFGWRATQCCSAYALQSPVFNCVGIIAQPFVFCNRSDEHFFAHAVNCRYLPTSRSQNCKFSVDSMKRDSCFVEWLDKSHICNSWSALIWL